MTEGRAKYGLLITLPWLEKKEFEFEDWSSSQAKSISSISGSENKKKLVENKFDSKYY